MASKAQKLGPEVALLPMKTLPPDTLGALEEVVPVWEGAMLYCHLETS